MKHISIAERYLPFSHRPGVRCVLPFSFYGIQIFPTLLRFFDMRGSSPTVIKEVAVEHSGPIDDFIVTLDLEKGRITVAGKNPGYFRYHLFAEGEKVVLYQEKGENSFNLFPAEQASIEIDLVSRVSPTEPHPVVCRDLSQLERLSLGSHRKQDEELIRRREKMEDVLALWHRLGLMLPVSSASPLSGTAAMLDNVGQGTPNDYLAPFAALWKMGLEGLFFPVLEDPLHQGISYPPLDKKSSLSSLVILSHGASLIRSLFVRGSGRQIDILPHLPTEFHCGRMTNISLDAVVIDLEWSKKLVRRMCVVPKESGEFIFTYPHVRSFRLRTSKKEKGERFAVEKTLLLHSGEKYIFDNFQK